MSNTDPSGTPPPPAPEFTLSKWQKRQATLLYHFASLDYLKGLKKLLDDFVNGVDITLDEAQFESRDQFLAREGWDVRDTVANFSTYGFPALKEFQRSVIEDIAMRVAESYDFTGYNQCARLLQELSMNWSMPEEEKRFRAGMSAIGTYAGPLDTTMRHAWDDSLFDTRWAKHGHLFPKLPKFRVRTDVEGESDKLPVRTGVYVPQDDPYGSLQFAWTGNTAGRLDDCETLNDLGLQAVNAVGRDALWTDDPRLLPIVTQPQYLDAFKARRSPLQTEQEHLNNARKAMVFISVAGVKRRPCKWYYVEQIEGEYEDPEPEVTPRSLRLRGEPGEAVPQSGWWHTLALKGEEGFRRFEQGQRFPDTKLTEWGQVIWSFDPERQPKA